MARRGKSQPATFERVTDIATRVPDDAGVEAIPVRRLGTRRHAAIVAFIGVVVTLMGVGVAVGLGAPPDLRDASATTAPTFRLAVLGWFVAIVGDVVRAWAIFVFFQSVNRALAMLGAWWMLLHDAVFAFALACLLVASELPDAAPLLLALYGYGFHLGLLLFSLHLLVNGYLSLRSPEVPKLVGWLLVVAFAGYFVDSAAKIALADPPALIGQLVALPNTVGELALAVWLLARGGRPRAA